MENFMRFRTREKAVSGDVGQYVFDITGAMAEGADRGFGSYPSIRAFGPGSDSPAEILVPSECPLLEAGKMRAAVNESGGGLTLVPVEEIKKANKFRLSAEEREAAVKATGGLGSASKMKGMARTYGLSNQVCEFGSIMRHVKGSVCSHCYAAHGQYAMPDAKGAHSRRLIGLGRPEWVESMIKLLKADTHAYFRWHDSGDLQGTDHLGKIVEIAYNVPDKRFWLPTLEQKIVKNFVEGEGGLPSNLVVRISTPMLDGSPSGLVAGLVESVGNVTASRVVTGRKYKSSDHPCPATDPATRMKGGTCLSHKCDACYNPSVKMTAYHLHD